MFILIGVIDFTLQRKHAKPKLRQVFLLRELL
jgi:hypothetical protein